VELRTSGKTLSRDDNFSYIETTYIVIKPKNHLYAAFAGFNYAKKEIFKRFEEDNLDSVFLDTSFLSKTDKVFLRDGFAKHNINLKRDALILRNKTDVFFAALVILLFMPLSFICISIYVKFFHRDLDTSVALTASLASSLFAVLLSVLWAFRVIPPQIKLTDEFIKIKRKAVPWRDIEEISFERGPAGKEFIFLKTKSAAAGYFAIKMPDIRVRIDRLKKESYKLLFIELPKYMPVQNLPGDKN
jgi:hypothetical protein